MYFLDLLLFPYRLGQNEPYRFLAQFIHTDYGIFSNFLLTLLFVLCRLSPFYYDSFLCGVHVSLLQFHLFCTSATVFSLPTKIFLHKHRSIRWSELLHLEFDWVRFFPFRWTFAVARIEMKYSEMATYTHKWRIAEQTADKLQKNWATEWKLKMFPIHFICTANGFYHPSSLTILYSIEFNVWCDYFVANRNRVPSNCKTYNAKVRTSRN